ncbi:methyltransferase domain-containing protein [Streptomyces bikiniensis]|uniref:methyltransferase domain-containing protein n=1 Tax=Streptomyces bikiniensis TaxID=1896 RepID=UPI0004C254A1|nr:methyltransferase domain-containing protein [Streptomyces bikiniensis]
MNDSSTDIALRALLGEVSADLGDLEPRLVQAAWAVRRHRFLPDRLWIGDGLEPCDRAASPEAWLRAAYADEPAVTQVNDGGSPDGERWPSSSASAPSIVFRMLRMLDAGPNHRVLEIGTGTGWNAGLLTHVVGPGNVTSVEVDPVLAAEARDRLREEGLDATVVTGDGAEGCTGNAPYDRLVATCSVRSVPRPWLAQVKPGGVILAPWESPWLCFGLLRLIVNGGVAEGPFSPHSAFMLMRGQRTDLRIFRDVVRDDHRPDESATTLSPRKVAGSDFDAQFAIGLQLRDVWRAWHENPVEGVETRLWVATTDATSWAAIDWDGKSEDRFTVWQYGPRRLWNEVEAAYAWWTLHNRPGPDRFGLTVTPEGQTAWLDTSRRPVPASG